MENGVSVGEGQGNRRLPLDGPSRSNQGQEAVEQKQTPAAQHSTVPPPHPPHPPNLLLLLLTCQIHFSDVERLTSYT